MKRFAISAIFVVLLAINWARAYQSGSSEPGTAGVSGQGKMRFRVLYTADHLPSEAQAVLKAAHGGFATDIRKGKGDLYFSLPGAGIIRISADLKSTAMVKTPAEMKDTNLHNTTFWVSKDGTPYLTFPGNQANRVFTTTLDGSLVQALDTPAAGTDLGNPTANSWFDGKGAFVPTDVAYLDGLLYVATGYSKLDFVLTARIGDPPRSGAVWNKLSFGGKGTAPGLFGTGHGITVPPGSQRMEVADRPNSEIDRFTRQGQYLSTLKMPPGSWPCDISYLHNYAVVGSLHGQDRTKGAPIYILENDTVISTIMPKEELGLKNFQHVHNAVLHEVGKNLYVIAQAWNPGDFAILEQVTN